MKGTFTQFSKQMSLTALNRWNWLLLTITVNYYERMTEIFIECQILKIIENLQKYLQFSMYQLLI